MIVENEIKSIKDDIRSIEDTILGRWKNGGIIQEIGKLSAVQRRQERLLTVALVITAANTLLLLLLLIQAIG